MAVLAENPILVYEVATDQGMLVGLAAGYFYYNINMKKVYLVTSTVEAYVVNQIAECILVFYGRPRQKPHNILVATVVGKVTPNSRWGYMHYNILPLALGTWYLVPTIST